MQYHIQTAPIWEAYRDEQCPLCAIRSAREKRLVTQYLTDNVMDPDFRQRSNYKGFCREHIRQMYAGQNKLGLGLQLETRAAALADLVKDAPKDKKAAKKLAATLKQHYGCVICDTLDEVMPRYCMTIAQMYFNESEFPELFAAAHHCFAHAIQLLDYAEYAGKSVPGYLAVLTTALRRDLKHTESELRDFADCFDHNSSAKPDPTAIPRAIELLI